MIICHFAFVIGCSKRSVRARVRPGVVVVVGAGGVPVGVPAVPDAASPIGSLRTSPFAEYNGSGNASFGFHVPAVNASV